MASSYCVQLIIILVLIFYSSAEISNDINFVSSESLPKPVSYFTFPPGEEVNENSEKSQEARFAYPNNLETAYGPNNVLAQGYYPWKFDVGGLVLGSVVGLGALLLIPKVVHLLVPELGGYGHGYGSLYRREADLMPRGINEIMTQVENVLTENNVNSSECIQKAICSYVQSTVPRVEQARFSDESNTFDKSLSSDIINFLIDGSKFKSAVENGRQDVSCGVLYPKCPFSQDSIASGVKQLMLNSNTFLKRNYNSN